MKDKLKFIILSLTLFPLQVLAQATRTGGGDGSGTGGGDASGNVVRLKNPLAAIGVDNFIKFLSWLTNLLVFLAGIFAVLAIVVAGYEMMLGGGDPEKIKTAKSRVTWAITGLILALLGYSIVRIILTLTAQSAPTSS